MIIDNRGAIAGKERHYINDRNKKMAKAYSYDLRKKVIEAIELVWHSAKEYIANKLFESVEELEKLLHKLLNEEGLIIKWGRKIKNKGNAIYLI